LSLRTDRVLSSEVEVEVEVEIEVESEIEVEVEVEAELPRYFATSDQYPVPSTLSISIL
jgi:hypothetical protein